MPKAIWSNHEVVLIAIDLTEEHREGGKFSAVERILTRRLLGRCNFQLCRKIGRPVTEKMAGKGFYFFRPVVPADDAPRRLSEAKEVVTILLTNRVPFGADVGELGSVRIVNVPVNVCEDLSRLVRGPC